VQGNVGDDSHLNLTFHGLLSVLLGQPIDLSIKWERLIFTINHSEAFVNFLQWIFGSYVVRMTGGQKLFRIICSVRFWY
jgi:hypothetical protein